MPSRAPALPDDIRTPTVSEALKRNARQLLLLSVFVGIVIFAALSMIAPRYQSEAQIAIEAKEAATGSSVAMDPASNPTYIRALRSPFLLKKVADALALNKRREFNSALGPVDTADAALRLVGIGKPRRGESDNNRVVEALLKHTDLHATKDGHAVAIRVTSVDPALAARIANTIASSYAAMLSQEANIEGAGSAHPNGANPADEKSAGHAPLQARILSNAQPAHIPAFPKKVELAAIASMASLMFGLAWVVLTTTIKGMPSRNAAKPPATAKKQAAPSLTETPETEVVVRARPPEPENVSMQAMQAPVKTPAAIVRPAAPVSDTGRTPNTFTEIEALASRLKARRPSGGGHRTLITSESEVVVPFAEALELAKVLAGCGAQTILIDWSPSGEGFAQTVGLDRKPGWNELLSGGAGFDDIIHRLPGTRAQTIASGEAMRKGRIKLDADLLNLALDALDEVYDHIIVTGRHDEARMLFECIEGRFDAGITVVPDDEEQTTVADNASVFIGFEVAEIDVLRYRQPEPVVSSMAQRIALATRPRGPMAQRA